jgi:hypothetical protein
MPTTYKVLGQVAPSATEDTTLYTVPASTATVASSISICNRSATGGTFRLAIRPAGETIANKHYISYDTAVPGNDSIHLTMGMTMGNTDVVTVYANNANFSFTLFGTELT